MVLTLNKQASEACYDELKHKEQETFANKCKYACALFQQIAKFQRNGVLCDTVLKAGEQKAPVKVHRVMMMSAKSFDSDYYSDRDSIDSDNEEDNFRCLSCSDDCPPVFEEAYHSDDEEMTNVTEQIDCINSLRQRGECCDVTLQAEGLSYEAHKVVLAAASDYFKLMFTSSMKEKKMHVINLDIAKQLDVSELPNVLNYMYTGQIDMNNDNIFHTLCLTVYFQIATLSEQCQNFLIAQVSKETCCRYYVLAKCFALEKLKHTAAEYIHDHFPELEGESHDITLLEKDDLPVHLDSDTLGQLCEPSKNTETRVLGNVMAWLTNAKFQYAEELLSQVRFSLVPREVIESHRVEQDSCSPENMQSIQACFQKALEYHTKLYEQPLLQSPNTQLRTKIRNWVCLDGVLAPKSIRLPSNSTHVQAPSKDTPLTENTQKIRDPFHSVVVLHGFVYVIGGTRQTSVGYSSDVERYDSRLDSWIHVPPMLEERGDFYACAIEDYIYVFGGRNRHGPMSSCERYDPRKNKWENISELPEALYMMAGEVEGGMVYLSGGFNEYDAVGTMLVYDPKRDEWDALSAYMFKDRGYHVMIRDGEGHLWVIGGIDNPFAGRNVWEVERFDIRDKMWSYVGQVLAVQPFLSIQRLNAFRDEDGHICVFAVTNIDHSPMMKYNLVENLWEAMEDPLNYFEIKTEGS